MKSKVKTMIAVNVTESDIAQGKRKDSKSCPVALAIRRELDDGCVVIVLRVTAVIFCPQGRKGSVVLPVNIRRFVGRFDQGKPVEPTAFSVPIHW